MNQTFTVDKDGKPITYRVLLTFYNESINKHFVVYTEDQDAKEGNVSVLVSSYDPDVENSPLMPVEGVEEWEIVNKAIEDFNDELMARLKGEADPAVEVSQSPENIEFKIDGKDYVALALFRDEVTGAEYIIYTEGGIDEDGRTAALVGKVTKKGADGRPLQIEPVSDAEEWETIEQPLNEILAKINEK